MSVSVLYMSMSLDGYIAGPNDEVGNPGGDGFDRLHEWLWDPAGGEFVRRRSGPAGELWDEMEATGASSHTVHLVAHHTHFSALGASLFIRRRKDLGDKLDHGFRKTALIR